MPYHERTHLPALCARCGERKPAESFKSNPRRSNGLSSWCRTCSRSERKGSRGACGECGRTGVLVGTVCETCLVTAEFNRCVGVHLHLPPDSPCADDRAVRRIEQAITNGIRAAA